MVQVYVRAVNTSGDINAVLFALSSDGSSQHPLWNLPSSMLLPTVWCELFAHNTVCMLQVWPPHVMMRWALCSPVAPFLSLQGNTCSLCMFVHA